MTKIVTNIKGLNIVTNMRITIKEGLGEVGTLGVVTSPVFPGHVKAPGVVRRGEVSCALASLTPVSNVPEVSTPGDQELGVSVGDPGGPAPHQGVGHSVAPLHGYKHQMTEIMVKLTSLLKWIIQTP